MHTTKYGPFAYIYILAHWNAGLLLQQHPLTDYEVMTMFVLIQLSFDCLCIPLTMSTIIVATAICKVRAVIRFLCADES